jgi:pre-mRNA-processing factor SLU7
MRGSKVIRSKYEEDVMVNDHLAVWGSWYNKYLGWGYSCCYSTQKMSYCLGLKGREKALAKEFKLRAEEVINQQKLKALEEKAE